MASISLYANITPNRHTFYYYTDVAKYTTFLATYKVADISLDNARLVNNILSIDNAQIGGALQNINLENVTYIREDRGNFIRFYSVRELQYMGGTMYQFVLQPDTWANYIARANFDHIMLKRSTRIPTGFWGKYDEIETVKAYTNPLNTLLSPIAKVNNFTPIANAPTLDDLDIAFSITYPVTKQATIVSGSYGVTNTRVLAIPCTTLKSTYGANTLEKCVSIISEIYARVLFNGTIDEDLPAYVNNIYIIRHTWFDIGTSITLRLKSSYIYNSQPIVNAAWEVINPKTICYYYPLQINPNYDYYLGTKNNGLKLQRLTRGKQGTANGAAIVFYEFVAKRDSLQFFAVQGDSRLDITSQFELGIASTNGPLMTQDKIKNALGLMSGITNALVQWVGYNFTGGIFGSAKSVFDAQKSPNSSYVGTGDALNSWYKTDASGFEYALGYTTYESTKNEVGNAIQHGVIINAAYTGTISSLFSDTPINDSIVSNTIVLQLDAEVKGVPMDASDIITQAFAKGIYIVNLP